MTLTSPSFTWLPDAVGLRRKTTYVTEGVVKMPTPVAKGEFISVSVLISSLYQAELLSG
jgi:hypothetical protein